MPRTWVLSDLHLENLGSDLRSLPPPPDFELLVVAGDVHEGDVRACVAAVARLAAGRPAVAVLGNHDLYGLDIDEATREAAEIGRRAGVHVLDGLPVRLCGLTVCGGTLWDDVGPRKTSLPRPDLTHIMSGAEPDFAAPPQFAPCGEPLWVSRDGARRRATFADIAARRERLLAAIGDADPDLVVTHHPPDDACLSRAPNAAAWIHGHVHAHARRLAGGTEVVVNARQSRAFAERMVMELGPAPRPCVAGGRFGG